jgi:PAS domain S-box-containing protein
MSCRLKKERKMNEKIIAGVVLNVLALEDSVRDFEIIREQLIDAGYHLNISRVDKEKEFESSIRGNQYDIILADFKLPGFDAFGALRLCNAICPEVPFICVSGSIGEETAIELIKQGAVDYILKDRLARLPSAIKRALNEAKEKEAKLMAEDILRNTEQQTRTFLDATSDMAFLKDESFRHIIVNSALCKFYGKAESEIIGKTDFDLMDKKAAAECRKTDEQTLRSNDLLISEEFVVGRYYETRKFPVLITVGKKGIGAYIRDITEHKIVEEATIRAAREWQMTFDSTNDMIWLLDSEQRVLRANKVSEKLFKHQCGDLFGMHCWDIVHGTTAPIPECPLLRAKKNLSRESMELQIGDDWFIVTVDPIVDATGQYDGAVHIVRDITDRKRSEEELRESEGKFRALADSAPTAVMLYQDDRWIYANSAAENISGYSVKELLTMNFWDFVHPDHKSLIQERGRKRQQGEETTNRYEFKIIAKNGTEKWVDLSGASTTLQGRPTSIISVLDITQRKQAEEALREKEVQYRTLADSGIALVWTSGTDKLCNYFNRPWLKFTGRTLEQEMGYGWTQGVHPDDLENCVQIYVTAFDKREVFNMEYRLHHVGGEYRWIRDLGTPNYDGSGKFIGYIGHCFDITAQKEAESQMEAAQEEIRNLNENLQQKIKERTAQLQENIDLLEETNRAFVGRELRMIELKKQIAELEKNVKHIT